MKPLRARNPGSHVCPARECSIEVPNTHFACSTHWWELPEDVRREIAATARLPLLNARRRKAIEAAFTAWGM